MTDPLLNIEDVTIQYGTQDGNLSAVSDASLTVERGELFGLVGESGCGKTTLAHSIIGGLDHNGSVTSGSITFDGHKLHEMSERELNKHIRWKEISYIPQNALDGLDPLQRISEKAWEISKIHTDNSKEETMDKLRELFGIMGLQESRISAYPHELSGGMQQRAVIALALLLEPKLVIADEPTTALDVITQDQVFEYLERVQEEFDLSVILITHDISVVFETCHRMAVLHAGQVAEVGTTEQVFDSPLHPYSIMLQDSFPDIRYPDQNLGVVDGYPPAEYGKVDYCTFVDRCPWAVEACREKAPPLEGIEGSGDEEHAAACIRKEEKLVDDYTRPETSSAEQSHRTDRGTVTSNESQPVLETVDLDVHFSQKKSLTNMFLSPFRDEELVRAVDGTHLELGANEVAAVIGESGCGKTTLLKTLIGLEDATGGDIRYRGKSLSEFSRSDWKEFRRNVQLIFQDPFNSLDPKMTVEETLREPLYIHGIDDRDRRVLETLEAVELSPPEKYAGQMPHQLSGGEKQRVSIARALILEPDVLLADEPVSMLDVSTQAAILNLLSRLSNEFDVSILYISHDLSTVGHLCDLVHVMYLGRIVESAPTAELIADPKHPYTQALINAIPIPDPHHVRHRTDIEGTAPDPIGLGEGCRFKDRCPERMDICEQTPAFLETGDDRHAACHLYNEQDTVIEEESAPIESESES